MDNQEIVLSAEDLSAAQAILIAKAVLMVRDAVGNYAPPSEKGFRLKIVQPEVGITTNNEYFDILGQLTGYEPDKIRAHFKKI